MSTRSDIIARLSDGTWARIYCYWDGYLDYNGRILFDHYTTQEKVEELIALGGLSSLGEVIGEKHPFDAPSPWLGSNFSKTNLAHEEYKVKYGKMCAAYHRDRGDELRIVKGESLAAVWPPEDTLTEFTYVWTSENGWKVGNPNEGSQTLISLAEMLDELNDGMNTENA